MILLWLLLGWLLAVPYVALGWRLPRDRGLAWWSAGLITASAIYVMLAVLDGRPEHAALEAVGVLLFGGAALWAARQRLGRALALAWALHPVWDLGIHLGLGVEAPAWYVWACLAFDLITGAAIWLWSREKPWPLAPEATP